VSAISDGGLRDVSVIELVLAVATGFALYSVAQNIGFRIFAPGAGFEVPAAQLLAPAFALAVCGGLLLLTTALRLRQSAAEPADIEAA
jgi:hypothetical protein